MLICGGRCRAFQRECAADGLWETDDSARYQYAEENEKRPYKNVCFSFKTVPNLPKDIERKIDTQFFFSGGSKPSFLSLTGGGRHKTIPGKEAMDAVGKDDSLSLRSIFSMKRRRVIIVSGVVMIALPTPGAPKTGAKEGCIGEEPQGPLIFRAKTTAESCTGCNIRMYA